MMAEKIVQLDTVRPVRNRKKKRGGVVLLFVFIVLIALATGAYLLIVPERDTYTLTSYQTAQVEKTTLEQTVEGSGEVVIPQKLILTSPEAGYSGELLTDEGADVSDGTVLGRIEVPDLEDSLEDSSFSLIDARSTLSRLKEQNRIAIERMQRTLNRLEDAVTDATDEVSRLESLVAINASRKSELETAQDALDSAVEERDEQVLQIEEETILNSLAVEASERIIEELELQRERLQERIASAEITSPFDGTVLAIQDVMTVSGSEVEKGTALFTVADPLSARVELEVSEKYARMIDPGQEVTVNISGTTYPGTVESVGAVAELASGSLEATVIVTVKPDTGGATILQGATAAAEFTVGAIDDALVLPRGAFLSTGSQQYVYAVNGAQARKTQVVYGDIQATKVEIVSGLQAGDEVIVSGYQNFIDHDVVELGGNR